MAVTKVPERLRWAVRSLDVAPGDRILEIGGGPPGSEHIAKVADIVTAALTANGFRATTR